MKRSSLPILAIVVLAFSGAFETARAAEPEIVPAVQQWQGSAGTLNLRGAAIVVAKDDEGLLRPTAELLQSDLARAGLPKPEIIGSKPDGKPAIVFGITQTPFKAGDKVIEEQSYGVEISGDAVTITGHNRAGIFYGTQSLLQMLAGGHVLACGRIIDGPVIRNRMLMLDVGRKPFPIETLYDYLRVLGWYKMNVLHLHLSDGAFGGKYGGFRVQCDTFPGLTSTDCFYTKKQLRAFQDRAAAMGIMVLPEVEMPGHATKLAHFWPDLAWKGSPEYLDVTNPATIERLKQLLDEMIPIFDAPYFHIGADEYQVHASSKEEASKVKVAFGQFINTMNAYVRSKGKTCITWDGPQMEGPVKIDPTVVIDAWLQNRDYMKDGYAVINSNQSTSYLTAGRPTYGINTAGAYQHWQPAIFRNCSPESDDPKFLGAKLHVWVGQGPTGWTMMEIADQTLPNIAVFAEKMWGRQGSPDYREFLARSAHVGLPSGITLFNRLPADAQGIVLQHAGEVTLSSEVPSMPLLAAQAASTTLSSHGRSRWMRRRFRPTAAASSSRQTWPRFATITRQPNGKGLLLPPGRARGKRWSPWPCKALGLSAPAGSAGATPAESHMAPENSRVFGDALPTGKWVNVTIVATRGHTEVYFDGKPAGRQNKQMICPLKRYGSTDAANSFIGQVKKLRLWDRDLSPAEVADLNK